MPMLPYLRRSPGERQDKVWPGLARYSHDQLDELAVASSGAGVAERTLGIRML